MGQTTRKKFSSNSFSEKRSTEALEVKNRKRKKKHFNIIKASGKMYKIILSEDYEKRRKKFVDTNAFKMTDEWEGNARVKKKMKWNVKSSREFREMKEEKKTISCEILVRMALVSAWGISLARLPCCISDSLVILPGVVENCRNASRVIFCLVR